MVKMLRYLLFILYISLIGHTTELPALNDCEDWGIFSFNSSISHTEGKGIGYKKGYTSLEFFLMPSFLAGDSLYPFIDLRGHGFNNQKLAANAGLGIRYLFDCRWLFGANLYYDYRQGDHKGFDELGYGFQQLGIGLEALGPCYDFRVNFYQPICKKKWRFTQTIFLDGSGITPTFIDKEQSTMTGFDAEIGGCIAHGSFCNCDWCWRSYLAGGPYYYKQEAGGGRWGGKIRLETHLGRYFFFEVRASYDHVDCGNVQVKAGIEIPLYPYSSVKPFEYYHDPYTDCSSYSQWRDWVSQPTERADIIPLKSHTR